MSDSEANLSCTAPFMENGFSEKKDKVFLLNCNIVLMYMEISSLVVR